MIAQPDKIGERGIYYKEVLHDHPVEPIKKTISYPDDVFSNCYKYVKFRFPNLPNSATVKSGASVALGEVAVFDYNGLQHFAVVESIGYGTFSVSETNFGVHAITHRDVSFSDPHFRGFYDLQ